MNKIGEEFLKTVIARLKYYKQLGEKTFEQLEENKNHLYP